MINKITNKIIIVRSGGDIATGVVQKLFRSGFKVVVCETQNPSSIRRGVCLSECIYSGNYSVEDVTSVFVKSIDEIYSAHEKNLVPVIIDETLEKTLKTKPIAVVDAILAKKNLGTTMQMAPITIGLGPGFVAKKDVNVVVETMRGHDLGRLIFEGAAQKNTGIPGEVGGESEKRVVYSDFSGIIENVRNIGDFVRKNETIARVGENNVVSKIDGTIRGLIREGFVVSKNLKIADIDPRKINIEDCFKISDKARNVGGAVLESILMQLKQLN